MIANFWRLTCGAVGMSGALCALGCSSADVQSDQEDASGNSSGGTSSGSDDSSSSSDSGGSSGSNSDTSSDGSIGPSPDPTCNSADASSGAECTVDCEIPCGYQEMGTKTCTCVGGMFESCPCPRPPEYLGAPTAPFCDDAENFEEATESGLMEDMDGLPCGSEWLQCIARDPPPGDTPRGCACLLNLITEELEWFCGSTNKWFGIER